MTKKPATKTRSRVRINARKTPHRPIAAPELKATTSPISTGSNVNVEASGLNTDSQWQTIQVPAPPGIYAGIDYDGNGVIFRRVDTYKAINVVETHIETLAGERLAVSSIAQFTGPLPEFGENPQFGMNILVSVPKKD